MLSLDDGISLPDEATDSQQAAQANEGEDSAEFVIDASGVLTKYNGAGGAVTIPGTVKTIGNSAFGNCDSLTSITVPGSVKTVGASAFTYCDSLSSVTLEAGVETIGESAFYSCDCLNTLKMGDGLKAVKQYAFRYSPIEELSFPDSVIELHSTAIHGGVYYNTTLAKSLKKVHWPAGVKEVHSGQFSGFAALETVELPTGVDTIASSAFLNCSKLSSVTIFSSVKKSVIIAL